MTDPIRAALERLVWLNEQRTTSFGWADAFTAARAALAAAPEGEPSDEELLAMRSWSCHGPTFDSDLVDFARAVLSRWGRPAAPPAPLEGVVNWSLEVAEAVDMLRDPERAMYQDVWFLRAATLLEQQEAELARLRSAPPAPLEGEVGELVAALRKASDGASAMGWERYSWVITRAAALLEQLAAAAPHPARPEEAWG